MTAARANAEERRERAGRQGYGPPFERDPALVARDVQRGYISAEQAREQYSVAQRSDGGVDAEATIFAPGLAPAGDS